MRRYVLSHLPMALGYALIIFAIRGAWWNGEWVRILSWGWWVLGVFIGVLLLFIDRIAYTYAYPAEQLSQQFSWYVREKKYLTALSLLDSRRMEQEKLTFRSALFMVVWVPLAFFALTSTSGLFGKGVVMGLMLHILADSWRLQKLDPQRLHVRLFWLIKRPVTPEERQVFMWVITASFAILSLWVR
jgi:hypothetical protein